MALDLNETNRSYLFGRLLAVADSVEGMALRDMKVDRLTAAMRYMDALSKRPAKTWMTIEKGLAPYFAKLKPGQRIYYEKIINSIMDMFQSGDYEKHQGLDERYLLGYHNQRQAIMKKKDQDISNQLNADED